MIFASLALCFCSFKPCFHFNKLRVHKHLSRTVRQLIDVSCRVLVNQFRRQYTRSFRADWRAGEIRRLSSLTWDSYLLTTQFWPSPASCLSGKRQIIEMRRNNWDVVFACWSAIEEAAGATPRSVFNGRRHGVVTVTNIRAAVDRSVSVVGQYLTAKPVILV